MFWNILERPLSFQKIPQYSFDIRKKIFLEDSTSLVLPDFFRTFPSKNNLKFLENSEVNNLFMSNIWDTKSK